MDLKKNFGLIKTVMFGEKFAMFGLIKIAMFGLIKIAMFGMNKIKAMFGLIKIAMFGMNKNKNHVRNEKCCVRDESKS